MCAHIFVFFRTTRHLHGGMRERIRVCACSFAQWLLHKMLSWRYGESVSKRGERKRIRVCAHVCVLFRTMVVAQDAFMAVWRECEERVRERERVSVCVCVRVCTSFCTMSIAPWPSVVERERVSVSVCGCVRDSFTVYHRRHINELS